MSIKDDLNISDDLWSRFKAWTPSVGEDPRHDDWIKLRLEILGFIHKCDDELVMQSPVIELGSWSLIPGGDFSFLAEKYKLYRTNISYGNGKAPLDFLLDAMDMGRIGNEAVGCIVATDVLEHLPDPFRALGEFYRVLKPGGYVLITVPFYFKIHGEDYIRFSPLGLEKALKDAGFDEVVINFESDTPLNIQAVARKRKQHSVLVLGGGKALNHISQMKKVFRVVVTDTKKDAPSLCVADKYFVVDSFASKALIENVIKIAKEEKISALIPSLHISLPFLNKYRQMFEAEGITVLMPQVDVVNGCLEKRLCSQLLSDAGLPVVPEVGPGIYPAFFKPNQGAGSVGVMKIEDEADFKYISQKFADYVLQEYIDGTEFTVDALCDLKGNLCIAVPRKRIEIGPDQVLKSVTFKDQQILDYMKQLTSKYLFVGIFTVQGFQTPDGYFFTEINPRLGGGLTISIAAGAPFYETLEKIITNEPVSYSEDWQEGAYFSRAYADYSLNALFEEKLNL